MCGRRGFRERLDSGRVTQEQFDEMMGRLNKLANEQRARSRAKRATSPTSPNHETQKEQVECVES